MNQISAEYIDQLEREATEQLPGKTVANMKAQAQRSLTGSQIAQLNNLINKLPISNFMGYLMYGVIHAGNLDQFTQLSDERRSIALAVIKKRKIESQEMPEAPEGQEEQDKKEGPLKPTTTEEPKVPEEPEAQEEPEVPKEPKAEIVQEVRERLKAVDVPEPPVQSPVLCDIALLGIPTMIKSFTAFFFTTQKSKAELRQFNLLNLPGEDIASKLSDNRNHVVSYEDLGAGATMQLCSPREKQLFFVFDPMGESLNFNILVNKADGQSHARAVSVQKKLSQPLLLKRLVELLSKPEARKILQHVSSFHFISTKADMLGNKCDEEALRRFRLTYEASINPLIKLCIDNGINAATNGKPMLFTFSMGHIHEATDHQYLPGDIDKLVELLKGNTASIL